MLHTRIASLTTRAPPVGSVALIKVRGQVLFVHKYSGNTDLSTASLIGFFYTFVSG